MILAKLYTIFRRTHAHCLCQAGYAEKRNVPAMMILGQLYNDPKFGVRDTGLAFKWMHAAASAGEPQAQYLLGVIYSKEKRDMPGRWGS